ncbi:hypothetical protein QOT17_007232 [Balamuthia mandrillaris]
MSTPNRFTKTYIALVLLCWFSFLLLLCALCLPWYITTTTYELMKDDHCSFTMTQLVFWASTTCDVSGQSTCGMYVSCPETSHFWTKSDDPILKHLTPVFETSLLLLLCTTTSSLFGALWFTYRSCSTSEASSPVNIVVASFMALGLCVLSALIPYFAIAFPNAWHEGLEEETGLDLPSSSFIGSSSAVVGSYKQTDRWAPIGWWLALVAWPVLLAAIAVAYHTAIPRRSNADGGRGEAERYKLLPK